MDQNFHGDVTTSLERQGVDCLRAEDDGTKAWDDEDLLAHATALGRVMVSSDRDILDIAGLWQATGRKFSGVVYGQLFRFTIGGAITDLKLIHDAQDSDDLVNEVVRLPL